MAEFRSLGEVGKTILEIASRMAEPLPEPDMLAVGHEALGIILARTKAGLDADAEPFKPYVPRYAAERIEAQLRPDPPDLTRTGMMLGSYLPTVTGTNEVTIRPMSRMESIKAAAHNRGVDKVVSTRGLTLDEYLAGARTRRPRRSWHMKLPRREHLAIRLPAEVEVLREAIAERYAKRFPGGGG